MLGLAPTCYLINHHLDLPKARVAPAIPAPQLAFIGMQDAGCARRCEAPGTLFYM